MDLEGAAASEARLEAIEEGIDPRLASKQWHADLKAFKALRAKQGHGPFVIPGSVAAKPPVPSRAGDRLSVCR